MQEEKTFEESVTTTSYRKMRHDKIEIDIN